MCTHLNNATVTVLFLLQNRSARSLSIARLGKRRYFTSLQTFTCCLISFGFRDNRNGLLLDIFTSALEFHDNKRLAIACYAKHLSYEKVSQPATVYSICSEMRKP